MTEYVRPRSLREALDTRAAHPDWMVLAGGTDLMVNANHRSAPVGILDLWRLEELCFIRADRDVVSIGAGATWWEVENHAVIGNRLSPLSLAAREIGALQIQARGTLGGNLATASPAADGVAALAAYDATIVVRSVRGERRIPFGDLQTGYKRGTRAPDEVIVAVEIALPPAGSPWIWRKVGTRRAQAISKVALAGVAVVGERRLARLGLGMASVAPVTALLPAVRALATSKPLAELTAAEVDAAVDADVSPIDDVRSTREYRAHCARAVVRGFLRELGARV